MAAKKKAPKVPGPESKAFEKYDAPQDKKAGVKEDSPADKKLDKKLYPKFAAEYPTMAKKLKKGKK